MVFASQKALYVAIGLHGMVFLFTLKGRRGSATRLGFLWGFCSLVALPLQRVSVLYRDILLFGAYEFILYK